MLKQMIWMIGVMLALPLCAHADYQLTILHFNDLQTRLLPVAADGTPCPISDAGATYCLGGAPRLVSLIKLTKAAQPNVLVIEGGGAFTGSNFWDAFKHRALTNVMKFEAIDAMGVGYAEFSEGSPVLSQFLRETNVPMLAANLAVDRDPALKDLIWPMVVLDRGGQRIGIIGYTAENIASLSHPSPQTLVSPIETSIKPWIKRMKEVMGAKKIVAVSYAGLATDRKVAAEVTDIDVIVSGNPSPVAKDSKDAAIIYPIVVKNPKGRPVLLVQNPAYGRSLGELDLVYDKKDVLKKWSGKPIPLDNKIPDDPATSLAVNDMVATMAGVNQPLGAPLGTTVITASPPSSNYTAVATKAPPNK